MSTFLGIDVGTSSVKSVLMDEDQSILASATAPLRVDLIVMAGSNKREDLLDDAGSSVAAPNVVTSEASPSVSTPPPGVGTSNTPHPRRIHPSEKPPADSTSPPPPLRRGPGNRR